MCSFNSWWGQTIVNCWSRSQLGMPCTGPGSTDHPEYVPALCTHRPSLLPMDYSVSIQERVPITSVMVIYVNVREQTGLKEREVVTRHQ